LSFLVERSDRNKAGLCTMTQIAARPERDTALLKIEEKIVRPFKVIGNI